MQTVVGVRFKKAGKIYYFGIGQLELAAGDDVIVETARGVEFGHIVLGPRQVEDEAVVLPLKAVQRRATDEDRAQAAKNREQEKEAFRIGEEKIAARGLPMKLVGVEYTFDINKIIFYFTAEGRIDFRELVKDLAAVFRTRIELRQIGVRDEAKILGGIGCCGRPLCCATFLGDFAPVSIRMAKEQNLSLNPTKISGICGRLMCCLKYESDCYACSQVVPKKVLAPQQGSRVVCVDGEGRVISLNQQRRQATILLDEGKTIVASWEDIIEKDEDDDLANVAALAAIAALQADGTGNGRERSPRGRGGRNRHLKDHGAGRKFHAGKNQRPGHEHEGSSHDEGGRGRRPREDRRSRRPRHDGDRRPQGE